MKTIILAGGFGSRLSEETQLKPKPMVEIGDKPILWHIMNIYAANGYVHFVVALGYKGEAIKEYFLHFYELNHDLTVDLATGGTKVHDRGLPKWTIDLVDTGLRTQTGGRIARLRDWIGEERFMLTYGDGLADVRIDELIAFHDAHGKLATVTAVRPSARFGELEFDGDKVKAFTEKQQTHAGWINGGFFVCEPGVFDYIDDDATIFEYAPLENLAADGQLHAYSHEGFWQPMDTLREKRYLEELWQSGRAPWKTW